MMNRGGYMYTNKGVKSLLDGDIVMDGFTLSTIGDVETNILTPKDMDQEEKMMYDVHRPSTLKINKGKKESKTQTRGGSAVR